MEEKDEQKKILEKQITEVWKTTIGREKQPKKNSTTKDNSKGDLKERRKRKLCLKEKYKERFSKKKKYIKNYD